MRKILTAVAATALLVACESSMDGDAVTGGENFPEAGSVPGSAEDFHKNVGDTVHFGFDKSDIDAEAAAALDKQAEWLKKWPSVMVVVEGHCDVRGTTEYNMGLGERRANAAKKHLVAKGVEAARVEVVSYGKEHPIAAGNDEAANAANRRDVTVVR